MKNYEQPKLAVRAYEDKDILTISRVTFDGGTEDPYDENWRTQDI